MVLVRGHRFPTLPLQNFPSQDPTTEAINRRRINKTILDGGSCGREITVAFWLGLKVTKTGIRYTDIFNNLNGVMVGVAYGRLMK